MSKLVSVPVTLDAEDINCIFTDVLYDFSKLPLNLPTRTCWPKVRRRTRSISSAMGAWDVGRNHIPLLKLILNREAQ